MISAILWDLIVVRDVTYINTDYDCTHACGHLRSFLSVDQ